MRKKKILFVVNHAGFFLSHRLCLALAARDEGYDVRVATPASKHVPQIQSHGLEWHALRLSRSGTNPLSESATFAGMYSLYRSVRPDLVHQVSSKPVLYGTPAARLARVPAVVNAISGLGHAFASGNRVLRHAVSQGYRTSLRHRRMRVVFQNAHHRDMFLANGWIRPAEAVLIPGSGVDTDEFIPAVGIARARPTVIFPARMLTTKGLIEFVEAARMLRARGVQAAFVLAGEPDPDNLASVSLDQLRNWNREGAVEYLGRQDKMAAMFASADIACLPSYHEGMPKSLIEAASCGLAIVTTDVPGCRDVVQHGENGFLVPARSTPELADALERVIRDSDLRRRMGARGRERAITEFSLPKILSAFMSVYAELLG